jgi:hypothetical protein
MAPKAEIKTDTLQINSPALWIKVTREFGFPTIVAIGLAVGWGFDHWYFMSRLSESQAVVNRRARHIEQYQKMIMQQKGFHINPEEDEEEDTDKPQK